MAFSEEDNEPSGSTCTDSIGEEGGTVNFGDGSAAWVEESSVGDSRTVRSFLRTSKGSSVLLRSLSLLPMDCTISGGGQV